MAVVLRATTPGFTAAKYDELVKKLDAAGAGSPVGRFIMYVSASPTIFASATSGNRAKLSKNSAKR
jgi:hypothetical protein